MAGLLVVESDSQVVAVVASSSVLVDVVDERRWRCPPSIVDIDLEGVFSAF